MPSRKKFETFVEAGENTGHISVPGDWGDHIVRVECISHQIPPLFRNAGEGDDVFIECSDGREFDGEVLKFEYDVLENPNRMIAGIVIGTGSDFYRVRISRSAGDDGWKDSDYTLSKALSPSEVHETDEVVSLELGEANGEFWEERGTVEGIAVKKLA